MTFTDLRDSVLDADLCANCGACAAVCPENVLTVTPDQPTPVLTPGAAEDVCGTCSLCTDVCPGRDTAVPQSEKRIFGRTREVEERWTGIVRHTYSAQAADPGVKEAASAGGAATALLVSALSRGEIDAALVVGRDAERPWVPEPKLVTTVEEIVSCAQASYCITPNLQILRDAPYDRIGVVGLACQIEAINRMRNLSEPPAVAERIAFTIEIGCASNTRREGTEHLIEDRLGLPLVDVTGMKYRAGEYPGEFTVWDREGAGHSLPFHELVLEFKKFKTFRCLACPDWWSGLADVSIADGDPNIFKTSRNTGRTEKASLLLTRTERGQALVDGAVENGDLRVTDETFIPDESLGLQRKRHRYTSYAQQHPGRVPHPPVDGEELEHPMDDDELIESMSRRK
ncbi:Coenzyme F420 hydrogenase/dehydrogenase, beta subunit C-terminal domain [Streptomyces sp. NPDC091267]|uniref:Coenzyme F420 hydrogenase/dehydrogenase, beta subunit C-terminal domain n=1 Tax=unclassified Streptomyces TaxID=2593676 RepID=UPI003418C2A4